MQCPIDRAPASACDRVLLVCEDQRLLDSMTARLGARRFSTARNGLAGVEMICRAIVSDEAFDTVIAQLDMAVLNGPEVLQRIRAISPETHTVLLASPACRASLGENPGWADYIVSTPHDLEQLLLALGSDS
jgi:DNA-binding response OmpR family regulator